MKGNANYFRHIYKLEKELKTYSVYNLESKTSYSNLLTNILRIEQYRNKSNATNIQEYLRLRTSTSWRNSEQVTGLRPFKESIFYGDRIKHGKKNLLIFQFSKGRTMLIIDVYRSFYPHTKGYLLKILKSHNYEI